IAVDAGTELFGEIFASDRAGGDPHHGLARRSPAPATMITQAVFLLVGVVGMTGAKAVLEPIVVARAGVGILDQQTDRGAGRAPLEPTGENAHRILLASLTHKVRAAGAASVDVGL